MVTLSTPEPLKLNAVAKPTPASLAETGISAKPPPISTNTPSEPEAVTTTPEPVKLILALFWITKDPV
jgi:hypothetical protein